MNKHPFESPETRNTTRPAPWGSRDPAASAPPPPPGEEPVRFYALRDRRAAWSGAALMAVLLSPLAFWAPDVFLAATLVNLAMALVQERLFRFEVTDSTLRLRLGLFARQRRLRLGEIAEAEALTLQGAPAGAVRPAIGHLRLRLRDGATILVPGLADPAEAAGAVRLLRDRAA